MRLVSLINFAAKVQQKMHIRKKSEKNYTKIIDFNLFCIFIFAAKLLKIFELRKYFC